MADATNIHIVIVNRNYPPRTGVTGESACALANWLQQNRNLKLSIVTVRSNYAGGGSKSDPVGEIHEIASWYDGKNKLLRLVAGFVESFRLIFKVRRLAPTSTIVMTDPIFLSTWAAILLRKRHWGLWSMDLYPEAFVAGKLVSRNNPMFRLLSWNVYRSPPKFLITLGELQANYLKKKYGCSIPTVILPCGVYESGVPSDKPDWKVQNSGKIILGYCGNLGEAHSVEFLNAVVEKLDSERFHLVLTVYGAKAKRFLENLGTNRPGVSLIESVNRSQLGLIDVHLVSLLGDWSHVCVPSKAVSAVCSGSSFLFFGIAECDNWKMLNRAGWIVNETGDVDLVQQVHKALQGITTNELCIRRAAAKEIAAELNAQVPISYEKIANYCSD